MLVIYENYRGKKNKPISEPVQAVEIISIAGKERVDGCYNVKSIYHFTIIPQSVLVFRL